MNIQKEIISPFNERRKEFYKHCDALQTREDRHRDLAEKYKQKKQKYREKHYDAQSDRRLIETLARAIAQRMGCSVDVGGPYGLFCRYRLTFIGNEPYNNGKRFHLVLETYWHEENGTVILYETGRTTTDYPADSLGAFNGGNHETKPLPDDLDDIIAIITRKS